ncbi:MAG: hypothetical protein QOH28_3848, partial [Actinomycetota bacterium]|nr:hypothetical protein [Actinomycetota bacterium]
RRVVVIRRILAASAAAVVVLGITAGAFAATSTKDRRRVSVVGSATTTTTTTPPGCTHLPTERVSRSYYGLKAPDGPSIDFLHSGGLSPVIDSRGNRAHSEGLEVQRTGPDGTVTLTLGANATVKLNGFGDFDGDGRGDLLIVTIAEDGIYRYYIVLGTVGAGTYAPAAVGVLVDPHYEPGDFGAEPASVGDQNGDGADDVSLGQRLYSGRQLAALPAGGALPPPFRTLPSPYVGLLQLGANGPASFVLPASSSLEVLDGRSDRLLLDAGDLTEALRNGARAGGWLVDGKHIVNYEYSTRGGGFEWRWNLDAPCGT